jgi:hypothetical protein
MRHPREKKERGGFGSSFILASVEGLGNGTERRNAASPHRTSQ